MKNSEQLYKAISERILVLDGAMGTMLQRYNFTEEDYRGERFKDWEHSVKGNNDLLSLTQSNAVHELNYESAKIARKVCDEFTAKNPAKPRFVAGSIGPTNRTASLSPDVNDPGFRAITFEELRIAYKQQSEALLDGGSDILLVETIFDTLNAKAALFAIDQIQEERNIKIPIMVSGTITDASGRTLSGQTAEAFLISVSHLNLLSVGFNCALGAEQLTPYLETISNNSEFYISAYPNAGLPNAFGQYDESPEQMAAQIKEYVEKGLINIIGGCCGTTPPHIKAIADLVKDYEPRKLNLRIR